MREVLVVLFDKITDQSKSINELKERLEKQELRNSENDKLIEKLKSNPSSASSPNIASPVAQPERKQTPPKKNPFQTLILTGHKKGVEVVVRLDDGRLVSCDGDEIRAWNLKTGQCVKIISGTYGVKSMAVLPDGRLLTHNQIGLIDMWDLERQENIKSISSKGVVYSITTLKNGQFATGGNFAGAIGFQDKVCIWNAEEGEVINAYPGHGGPILALSALQDNRLASASADKTVRIWNLEKKHCDKVLNGHTGSVNLLTTLPNGLLASGSEDKTVRIWNVDNGVSIRVLTFKLSVWGVSSLVDGRLITGSGRNTVHAWDIESRTAIKINSGHEAEVRTLTTTLDGRLVSGGKDTTIRVAGVTE
ncbi:COMPASS component SWD3 [Acrasis kona]